MANVVECIEKAVVAKQITRAVADEAVEFFNRSRAKWSRTTGPASADAAAAVETAKKMSDRAREKQIAIAASVSRWQTLETRLVEDPRGKNAAAAGMLAKDTISGDDRLKPLIKSDPQHPIFSDGNVDSRTSAVNETLSYILGPEIDAYKARTFKGAQEVLTGNKNFIYELFGVDSGNALAKTVAGGFTKMVYAGVARAKAAGKIFNELEGWRIMQHWVPDRVARVPEAVYVKDHMDEIASGGLKLFDKENNTYAKASQYEDMLKKAYSDIKTEGGRDAPFSKQGRTFEFQQGQAGADSWLNLQAKYGVGNEVMAAVVGHQNRMARDIALHEVLGPNPDAMWAAIMRTVKNDPSSPVKGFGMFSSERTLQLTYDVVSGRGHPVANETFARIMAGGRDIVGVASLRNLPITIIPGDTLMTFTSMLYQGMSGLNVLAHVFDGAMTREIAQHLGISAHSSIEFVNNTVRKYEDQINVSGLARRVSRAVTKATGADLWTRNGRLGVRVSQFAQLTDAGHLPFDKLEPGLRENFLQLYGITSEDWDKIRTSPLYEAPNGAKYINPMTLPEGRLGERLLAAVDERSSYAFHQPDARTQAIMGQGAVRGTVGGEIVASMGQYKQFTMERMTTHMMRILTDGSGYTASPTFNRINRGLGFTALSMAAGAVSLQAAAVVAGKDPLDMARPGFWAEAFARGGAGGIYGDVLTAAIHGDRGGANIMAQFAGPLPGAFGDIAGLAINPTKREFGENNRSKATFGGDAIAFARRHAPQEWYTKLAVDRLLFDKLQILVDPNYRQSFRRQSELAKKSGSGFWWAPGTSAPSGAPGLH